MTYLNTASIEAAQRRAFAMLRENLGSPTLDIVRNVRSGEDPKRGVKGTVADAGIQDVPCVWQDLSIVKAGERGIQTDTAVRVFSAYDLTEPDGYGGTTPFTVRMTDQIVHDGRYFEITQVNTLPSGRVEIACRLEN